MSNKSDFAALVEAEGEVQKNLEYFNNQICYNREYFFYYMLAGTVNVLVIVFLRMPILGWFNGLAALFSFYLAYRCMVRWKLAYKISLLGEALHYDIAKIITEEGRGSRDEV